MVSIKYNISEIKGMAGISKTAARMENMQPALKDCGLHLIRSIAMNFKAGGRPVKWKKSARAKSMIKGQTLIKDGRLKNSITPSLKVTANSFTVGTNVKYARIHQLGGRITKNATVKQHRRIMTRAFGKKIPARHVLVRSHKRQMNTTIPARPFLVVQPADWRIFKRIIADYIAGK